MASLILNNNNIKGIFLGSFNVQLYLGETPFADPGYFHFYITSGGDITWTGSTNNNSLSYSKDYGKTWTSIGSSGTISVNAGNTILWKGTATPQTDTGIGTFSGDENLRFNAKGNIMSLLYGDNYENLLSLSNKDYAFCKLFLDNANIVNANSMILPATTLSNYCYANMFNNCSSLVKPPELPATTLLQNCYRYMFNECRAMTLAPYLGATNLADRCYLGMFNNCKSLTVVLDILPATTLKLFCYYLLYKGCTGLSSAPELPATTLVSSCYQQMFIGCTNLTYIKAMMLTAPGTSYTQDWVNTVASKGTFVKSIEATWDVTGRNGVPSNWTIILE